MPDSVQFGEGINLLGDGGTGNLCVNATTTLTDPRIDTQPGSPIYEEENRYNDPFHRAFWVHSFEQYESRVRQATAIENGEVFDFEDIDTVAASHYAEVFDSYDGPVLTIISVIPTADITVSESAIDCDEGQTTLDQWVNDCGVRYLGERKLGRYFFLSARVPDLTPVLNEDNKWSDFYRIFDVESYTNHPTNDAIASINSLYPGLELIYHHRNGDGRLGLEEWPDLRDDIYQAVQNGDPGAYGVTIWERTPIYDASGPLEEVCIGDEITNAFGCYQRFEYWSQRVRNISGNKLLLIEDAYNNPQDYEPVTQAEYDNYESVLIDFYQLLAGSNPAIDTLTQDCVDSLGSADENTICTECNGAANEIEALVNRLDQISDPELLAPSGQTYGVPTQPDIDIEELELDKTSPAIYRDFNDSVCMLSRVGGKFEGTGERVRIRSNTASNDWFMEVASHRNNGSERVTGTFTCSDGFVRDACGGVYCKHYQECDTNTDTCVVDPDYFNTLFNFVAAGTSTLTVEDVKPGGSYPDKPYLAPLAGLAGKMDGPSEGVWTVQDPTTAQVRSDSQVGQIRGYSTGMRLFGSASHQFPAIDPNSQNATEFTIETGIVNNQITADRVEESLLSSSEAFCYLTEIKGNFDGAGEHVGVENVNGTWVLRVNVGRYQNCGPLSANNCEPKPVRVTARCVRYQRI